jgi:mycothiol synthase
MVTNTDRAAGAASGRGAGELVLRPFELDRDLVALVDVIGESNLDDGVDWIPTAESLRVDLVHRADFDAARDIRIAELGGAVVGAADHMVRTRGDTIVHHLDGWVRPSHRRRGIGRTLLHWSEERAREVKTAIPGELPHAFAIWPDEHQVGTIAMLESEGYGIMRYGFMMLRRLGDPIPDAPLPAGLQIRPVRPEDHRRVWDADVEAFRDHWKTPVRTEEDFTGWFATPDLDTTLWRVAWDGDEVAGSVMSFVFADENERLGLKRGWLEHVSVRRPWRRQGLGAALIADSLRGLRERGLDEAALGVDAENTTGALRLYESLGFYRHRMGILYTKAL